MATISIVIINYNTFELTCNCIQSILEREQSLDFEIILVDNASVEIDPDHFCRRFPQISLIKCATNVGFSKGNNLGIAMAKGQFILLLNSDTVLANSAITIALNTLRNGAMLGAVGVRLEYPDGRLQHNCQRFPSVYYRAIELFRIQKLLPQRIAGRLLLGSFFNHNENVYVDWIWGTFFMFRKELLLELPNKKLNEQFFMYGEDMQWCYDFRKLGYYITFEPKAQVVHHMGMSGGKKNEMMRDNLKTFMHQHYSSIKIWILGIIDRLLIPGR